MSTIDDSKPPVNIQLSSNEKWLLRRLEINGPIPDALLGGEGYKLTDMGLIDDGEGWVAITEKGRAHLKSLDNPSKKSRSISA